MLKWAVRAGAQAAMEHPPRLCHVKKCEQFIGYGFNLHTDKSKMVQLVGNVDPGSPADAAGVKKGDKIIEVNGTNISNENHGQVVNRIKAGGEETCILVADRECVEWHKDRAVVISSALAYVIRLSSEKDKAPSSSSSSDEDEEEEEVEEVPVVRPTSPLPAAACPVVEEEEDMLEAPHGEEKEEAKREEEGVEEMDKERRKEKEEEKEEEMAESEMRRPASPPRPVHTAPEEVSSSSSESEEEEAQDFGQVYKKAEEEEAMDARQEEEEVVPPGPAPGPPVPVPGPLAPAPGPPSPGRSRSSSSSSGSSAGPPVGRASANSANKDELVAGLHLNLTAAEMRARVTRNKKTDPRKDKIDLRQKAEMIKNL